MSKKYYFILLLGGLVLFSCDRNETEEIPNTECNCFIETATDTYSYPVRPGSDEWNAFTSSDQMAEAVQVPVSILDTMSTIGVYETCAENPLGIELYIVNSPQRFFDFSLDKFNAYKELISRNDVASELIKRYSLMCLDCEENNYSSFSGKGGDVQYAFVSIELLLAQEATLSKASKSQCVFLGQLITNVYKKNIINNQSAFFKRFQVWIASRIMDKYNYAGFKELESKNEQISIFNKTGSSIIEIGSGYTAENIYQDIMEQFKSFLNTEL